MVHTCMCTYFKYMCTYLYTVSCLNVQCIQHSIPTYMYVQYTKKNIIITYNQMHPHSRTGIFKIIESQFPAFQRFSSSKLVLKTVESRFSALRYFENLSNACSSFNNVRSKTYWRMQNNCSSSDRFITVQCRIICTECAFL